MTLLKEATQFTDIELPHTPRDRMDILLSPQIKLYEIVDFLFPNYSLLFSKEGD